MSELKNFPFKNQLNSPTLDGHPDENREFNCVPTCIAAALQYLTGKVYEPDQLKDAVYGDGYVGGTSAAAYVSYVARQGVRLAPINGNGKALVAEAHRQLALGHPVLITEPDPYAAPSLGYTHVVVFYKDLPDTLIAMDPFGGVARAAADQVWAARIDATGGQIWIMQRLLIPEGWHDDGTTLTAPNGHHVIKGFREYLLTREWPAANWPLEDEHHLTPLEVSNPSLGGGSQQIFRWTVLEWTPQRGVFEMWTGQELLALRALIDDLQDRLAHLQQAAKPAAPATSLPVASPAAQQPTTEGQRSPTSHT
jgi:hypothetical protein